MAPNLQVRKSQCTGTAFGGIYVQKVTYMHLTQHRRAYKKFDTNGIHCHPSSNNGTGAAPGCEQHTQ